MSEDEESISIDSSVSNSVQIDSAQSSSFSDLNTYRVRPSILFSPDDFANRENMPVQIHIMRSLSSIMLCAVNEFRHNHQRPYLNEDPNLTAIAMDHSIHMTKSPSNFNTATISDKMNQYSFVCFEAHVSHHPSNEYAFTSVVNTWTTEPGIMKSILSDFNVGAVGAAISSTNEAYFTLILALRSIIGNSFYRGPSLKSMILAEKSIEVLNDVRSTHFSLRPIKFDTKLSEFAFLFGKMNRYELTNEYVQSRIGVFSSLKITFGKIEVKHKNSITPEQIVEEWLNKIGKSQSFLGDFNRIGVGFYQNKKTLHSVILLVRSIQAALVDGTESMIEEGIIAQEIGQMLSKFREQHKLNSLSIDEDLCEIAERHAIYVANGKIGVDPLEDDDYLTKVEPRYSAVDISHMVIAELSKVPLMLMAKWRRNEGCLSVILSHLDDIGIGVAFDETFLCHVTVMLAAVDDDDSNDEIVNRIVVF
ncbi:hypothetical protein TRFO_03182 [Tritrichomonas foetus]|uniref:SCP domain-containing protein n=1 Tax=Tritrichomonas foetus TaxID=1144522 RepID=A0A1J4KWQ8_9EUKA|nr:hypothetical protein TRFO_03182 [Tritrichomonas foetus]|eukprot:OHT14142.1 hypothetical protein TRFO_03182 [Tritrichomonas foetus]